MKDTISIHTHVPYLVHIVMHTVTIHELLHKYIHTHIQHASQYTCIQEKHTYVWKCIPSYIYSTHNPSTLPQYIHIYISCPHMCEYMHLYNMHTHSRRLSVWFFQPYLKSASVSSWAVYFLPVIELSGVKDLYFMQPCKYHFSFHNPGLWFIFMVTKSFNKLKQISLTQAKRKRTHLPKHPFCHCESKLLGTLPPVLVSSESKTRERKSADLQPKVLSLA